MRARQDPGSDRPRLSFRTWSALLVLAVAVPLLIFGGVTLYWMAQQQASIFAQTQADTVRMLASAVDGELRAWKAALAALAQSSTLLRGDLKNFYEEATAVAAQYDGWIVLTDPTGQQRLNTRRPYGAPLPKSNVPEFRIAVLTKREPTVSDLFVGALTQRWIAAVAVPVVRGGDAPYMMDMAIPPARLTALLKRPGLPAGWTLVIFDSQQRVVTRLPLTEERMGKLAQGWVAAALRSGDHGTAMGRDIQGIPHRVAFQRLTETPWTVSVSIPVDALPSSRPVYWFLALGLALGAVAVALAVTATWKLTRPIIELAGRAEQIVRGETGDLKAGSSVREIHHLERALMHAAFTAQMLQQEQQRALAAEARAEAESQAADALRQEVKQRHEAEAALRESEALLRALTENSPDAIYVKDCASRWMMANPAVLRLVGKTAQEALGKTDQDLYADPEIGRVIVENDRRILEGGQPGIFEEVADTPEGRRTFLSIKAPRHDANGTVIGLVGISHDITARKQAEAALQASERRERERAAELATILDAVPTPVILVHNAAGTHLTGNRAADELLRLPRGGEISLSAPSEVRPRHLKAVKDGRELRIEELPAQVAARGIPVKDFEYRLVFDDGSARDLLAYGTPLFDGQGEPRGAVHTLVDITDRKRAEKMLAAAHGQLQSIINNTPAVVYAFDLEERFVLANTALAELLNTTPEQLIGKRRHEFMPQQDADWHEANDRQVIETGRAMDFEEYNQLKGRSITWLTTKFPLRDVQGKIYAVAGISAEITERKQAEETLRQLNATLERRVRERTADLQRLTGDLAVAEQRERQRLSELLHDGLQQLLVGARLRTELLARADADRLADGCRTVAALLNEAIAASRSLSAELSPPVLQQAGLLPALQWLASWMQDTHRLSVELTADPAAEPTQPAVKFLLFQAVRELLFNAVKHAGVSRATLEVAHRDGHLQIVVADRGAGFDPARLANSAGATGLGLPSIRQRIEYLGGTLDIQSAPGQGCRGTLVVPLETPYQAPRAAEPVRSAAPSVPAAGGRTLRLLLVDDHVVMRQSLTRLLSGEPSLEIVGEAADGKQAIELAGKLQPDCVLMDISMPVMDGIEATRRIRTAHPRIQVIGLSMYEDPAQMRAMHEAGAAEYVAKTSATEVLLAAIRSCAGQARAT
jgi:PAS domain S-box-containing protein